MTAVPDERPVPYEVPPREVEHDFPDEGRTGADYIGHVGEAKYTRDWMTDEALAEWEAEMSRQEEARRKLGGFGFRGRRA